MSAYSCTYDLSARCNRRNLKIGASEAILGELSFGEAPQNRDNYLRILIPEAVPNPKKHVRRQKTKCWGSPETHFEGSVNAKKEPEGSRQKPADAGRQGPPLKQWFRNPAQGCFVNVVGRQFRNN